MASSALAKAEAKIAALRSRMASAREEYADTLQEALGVAVGMGAGFAFGAAEEKWGEDAVFGTSVPAVVGIPATALALAGFGGAARGVLLETGKAGLTIEAFKGGARVTRDWMRDDEEEPAPAGR